MNRIATPQEVPVVNSASRQALDTAPLTTDTLTGTTPQGSNSEPVDPVRDGTH
jgi:hypothetical protein